MNLSKIESVTVHQPLLPESLVMVRLLLQVLVAVRNYSTIFSNPKEFKRKFMEYSG